MSWPDGFSDGCKLLRPDAIFVIFEAINERINWRNEVNGKIIVSPLDMPDRFVMKDGTELNNIKKTISNTVVGMASSYFSNISADGFNRPEIGVGSSTLTNKYGNPNNLYKILLSYDFDSNWLFCVYNWLNELIYPIFEVSPQIFVESLREVKFAAVMEQPRIHTLVYTKNGSSVKRADGSYLDGYAWAGVRPSPESVDEYYEKAETLVPGWVSANSLNVYNFVNGTYGSLGPASDPVATISRKTVMRANTVRFYSENSYIEEFDCRAKWTNFSKWTMRKKDPSFVVTDYPEMGTYFYGTIVNGSSDSISIHIYDDPDYHFSNTMTEAWNDPELFFCATQYVSSSRASVKISSLPPPTYQYYTES